MPLQGQTLIIKPASILSDWQCTLKLWFDHRYKQWQIPITWSKYQTRRWRWQYRDFRMRKLQLQRDSPCPHKLTCFTCHFPICFKSSVCFKSSEPANKVECSHVKAFSPLSAVQSIKIASEQLLFLSPATTHFAPPASARYSHETVLQNSQLCCGGICNRKEMGIS